jgi:uncharacterized protein involved in outer membrane biogenesis
MLKTRTHKIVFILLIGLLFLVVLAVGALFFVDPAVFRGQLEARASAALGRHFQTEGPIRLERSLRPRIIIENITIGNPDWASGAHFAEAEKVGVQVALLPLLRGDLKILDVSFTGVNLSIEKGPDGANNYTFGDGGESQEPGVLPPIEQLLLRDVTINYQTADAGISQYKIDEARLWNIPGEPERIEGKGSAKGMPFTILLAADTASELSGPQNPWSLKLDIEGPDMSLTLTGRMVQAFKWDKGDYRITISGKQADELENLLGVEFPTTGPFELSGALSLTERSYKLTDLIVHIHGPSGTPDLQIRSGEMSGGPDGPLQIALQGQYGDAPFAITFESPQPFEGTSQTTPWPIEAQLSFADTKLNIEGTIIPATAAERVELDAQLQGETLNTMAQLFDTDLPQAGPYQLSFRANIAADSYTLTDLEGHIKGSELWQTIGIAGGEVSALESGSVKASIDAKLDNVPLSLSFQGGPEASGKAGATAWPVKLEASASGATLTGEGSVVTTGKRKVLKMATRIEGNRFESLGPLIGVSLPAIGKFNLNADVSSDGDVHTAGNLQIQMGTNRLTGNVRWEDKAPRPYLTGELSSDSVTLNALGDPSSKPTPKTGQAGHLDRPIELAWLKDVDAKLDLNVKRVADSPFPVENVRFAVTLANGKLSAPFRAKLSGTPIEGQMHLSQPQNLPAVSLKAALGRIDVGQTLKQLGFSDIIAGTADAVNLDGSSTGKTLQTLLDRAAVTLQIKPANLNYSGRIADQALEVTLYSAELTAGRDNPLTAVFEGTLNGTAFNGNVSTANLVEIWKSNTPLTVRAALQAEDVRFKAEGAIDRPIESNVFSLKYELSGKEIEGLDPLADFAVPLRGAFRAQGLITARGNRFTYEEDLRVGKSDLKANITVLRESPRPKIAGRIFASQIHLDDMILFDANKDSGSVADKSRVIPDYTVPVDVLLTADLDLDIQAERILAGKNDLGKYVSKVWLKDGRFKSSLNVTGFKGALISSEFDLNAGVDPPMIKIQLNAKDLDFGYFLESMEVTDLLEGQIDLHVDLSGSGSTRYDFLENAAGRITVIGGPGKISSRMIELWAADLIRTMLSPRWQTEAVTDMNCFVAHMELQEGLAEIEDLLLDTQRITVAGSGTLDMKTEALDLLFAPRPKQASLVSLANPVRIGGTLSKPEVSVTRIPRRGRLAGAGILAGLINPAFLIFAFSDTGTGEANPCDAIVEQIREAAGIDTQ